MENPITQSYTRQIKKITDSIIASILGNFPPNAEVINIENAGIAIEYNLGKEDNRLVYAISSDGILFVHTSFDNDDDFEDFPFDIDEDDDDYPNYEDNICILQELELEELLNLLSAIEKKNYTIIY